MCRTCQKRKICFQGSVKYQRFDRTVWNYNTMPLHVTLDPFECKIIIRHLNGTNNQSRICGKGVGLSLFPSDSLSFESYEQFVKKSNNDCFLAIFGLNLAMFLTSQPYEFNEIAHKGP